MDRKYVMYNMYRRIRSTRMAIGGPCSDFRTYRTSSTFLIGILPPSPKLHTYMLPPLTRPRSPSLVNPYSSSAIHSNDLRSRQSRVFGVGCLSAYRTVHVEICGAYDAVFAKAARAHHTRWFDRSLTKRTLLNELTTLH
jgi:hypothetical protein